MHRGYVDVRGNMEDIKRYYGVGYKFEIEAENQGLNSKMDALDKLESIGMDLDI